MMPKDLLHKGEFVMSCNNRRTTADKIRGGIFGLAVGDALGVPVEFCERWQREDDPVVDMRGYGIHGQPVGTWSDDTSLALALLDGLEDGPTDEVNYDGIMSRFCGWLEKGDYTPFGEVFDVGMATRKAIRRYKSGTEPLLCGGTSERDNGNGSLMRILPIAFYLADRFAGELRSGRFAPTEAMMEIIHNVSALTHGHARSQMACGIYVLIALRIRTREESLDESIKQGVAAAKAYYENRPEFASEMASFKRFFNGSLSNVAPENIKSSGYVVDTLEAAIWSLLTTDSYRNAVLKAVNLGSDTDTVGAVTGGLAGLFYGEDAIPSDWLEKIARREYIATLCQNLARAAAKPVPISYRVADYFYAGEYPGSHEAGEARRRVKSMTDFGVTDFIDLTEPGELEPYDQLLPKTVRHWRFAVRDGSVPLSIEYADEIVRKIDELLAHGRTVYLHCWGGVGRTGTIVACWFARSDRIDGNEALALLREKYADCSKSKNRPSPETLEQERFVLKYAEKCR